MAYERDRRGRYVTRPVKHPGKDDLLWLAGLLEGEGCFFEHHHRYPAIALSMTDEDVVEYVAKLMNTTYYMIKSVNGNKPVFRCAISGTNAVTFMKWIRPYMHIRRGKRIDELVGK